jgi:hypothetical protein
MENAPIIRITARRIQPEYEERFLNWSLGAYHPLLITVPGFEQIDDYRIVKENPQYTKTLTLFHYRNRAEQLKPRGDQRFLDVQKDTEITWASRSELIWMSSYQEISIFKENSVTAEKKALSKDENAPVIHLEGYAFSNPEQERYDTWFNKWGREVFIPLIMRLPGLKEYTRYKLIDVDSTGLSNFNRTKHPVEYPPRLSILTFENIKAFENYENSLELAAFKSALQAPFPLGLNYQWYVQYQLVKSWRK